MTNWLGDYLLGMLVTNRVGIGSMLAEVGRMAAREDLKDYIWDCVKRGESFMYDLREGDEEEEWVFVRLPGDDADLQPDDITFEDFVAIEPSFRPLGIWYKSHYPDGPPNDEDDEFYLDVDDDDGELD
ncbi:hypothetical protein [Alicyclobacillus sp. SO9]|uniref:hypothetical protein n=1 Tax=Alicyclobacillus sp. SO9 TaxID=2665646 RepID=UPI0018E70AB6|nr:hypothetical protein [Alicyclobacillus sp. SO9]QQE80450.1 hypothetical protein GI364_08575 [Alicyclobacillus sp. SO9]